MGRYHSKSRGSRRSLQPEKKKKRATRRFLIVCEGETEKYYFQGMNIDEEYGCQKKKYALTIKQNNSKNDPIKMFEWANKEHTQEKNGNNEYTDVWLVFDHDGNQDKRETKRQTAFEQAQKAGFFVAFSAINFEMWCLLHFRKQAPSYNKGSQAKNKLKKHISDYETGMKDIFDRLKSKLPTACKNAKWLRKQTDKETPIYDRNPYTNIDLLVKELTIQSHT